MSGPKACHPGCHPGRKHYAKGLCLECYLFTNRVHKAAYDKQYAPFWRASHKQEVREYNKLYDATRRRTDINYRLIKNLRNRLRTAVAANQRKGSAITDLGCSIQHLKLHLELFWDEGMSWDNYGTKDRQWTIEPLSRFNLFDRAQFLVANHYLNLQPLWHKDNCSKRDR